MHHPTPPPALPVTGCPPIRRPPGDARRVRRPGHRLQRRLGPRPRRRRRPGGGGSSGAGSDATATADPTDGPEADAGTDPAPAPARADAGGAADTPRADRAPADAPAPSYPQDDPAFVPTPGSFERVKLATRVGRVMAIDVAPNDDVFIAERDGALKIWKAGGELVTAGMLEVFTGNEDGFLGVILDPAFASTRWVYLLYTARNAPEQHLSRFEVRNDQLVMASEKIVLKIPEDRDDCCHVGGGMDFDAQGNLYISVGDNSDPFQSNGYAPIDSRPGRKVFDAQRTSGNTNDLRGKILRIKPMPDGSYTVPPATCSSAAAAAPRSTSWAPATPSASASTACTAGCTGARWAPTPATAATRSARAGRAATTSSTRPRRRATTAGPTASPTTSPTSPSTSPATRAAPPSTVRRPSTSRPTTRAPAPCRPPAPPGPTTATAARSGAAAGARPSPAPSTTGSRAARPGSCRGPTTARSS